MNTERFAHLPLPLTRPSGNENTPPPREFEGIAYELDLADEEDGVIMQQYTQYTLLESTRKIADTITEFAQSHRIALTVGVTATLIAANLAIDHLSRPKAHNST